MNPTNEVQSDLFQIFFFLIMAFIDKVYLLSVLKHSFSGNLIHQFACQLFP